MDLILFLIIVAVLLAVLPMDATIKQVLVVIIVVGALLAFFGNIDVHFPRFR